MGIANSLRRAVRIRRYGPVTWTMVIAVTGVLVLLAGWGGYQLVRDDRSCAEGVSELGPDRECVGITDGRFSFAPQLDDVSARIKEENDRIAAAGLPLATVAFIIPLTSDDRVERQQTLREVQGAHLAQRRANHDDNDQRPAIRLLLASPGRDGAHWRPVAEDLVRMAHDPAATLRLVTGFNTSVRNTADALGYLTSHGIPVVVGPLTADEIGNSTTQPDAYPGLVKVVPNNSDQAAALTSYNADLIDPTSTLLVEDQREGDNYIESLRHVFRGYTTDARYDSEQFTSPGVSELGTTPNQFAQMVDTICTSRARWIYFAGRPLHLRVFVNALGNRGCAHEDFTVITGSGASTLANDPELDWNALASGVNVQYTAIAHPEAWTRPDAPDTGGSGQDYQRLEDLAAAAGSIGEVSLTDSRTITMYDAVWTGITGIRKAGTGQLPSLQAIIDIWPRLHGPDHRVNGASGWICLDNHGHAHNKAVSVVTLDPDSPGSILFQGVAWPQGQPPEPECLVSNPQ